MHNLLMNGGVDYDQAREGAAVTLTNNATTLLADGFTARLSTANGGVISCQRVTDAPPGFGQSLKATVITAASSVAAGDRLSFVIPLEAIVHNQLAYGTASAKTKSDSIWMKPTITGSGSVLLSVGYVNPNGTRGLARSVSLADGAWTNVALDSIPGCTDGTWPTTGAMGYLVISPVVGTTFQTNIGNVNTWQSANIFGHSLQNNTLLTTVNATFQIAGLSSVINSTAIAYEVDPNEYSRVRMRFQKSYDQGVAIGASTYNGSEYARAQSSTDSAYGHSKSFPVPMLDTPTVTYISAFTGVTGKVWDANNSADKSVSPFVSSQKGFSHTVFNLSGSFGTTYHWTADCRLT